MPLTAQGCLTRRKRLIETSGAALLLLSDPRHIFYLTGFYSSALVLNAHIPRYLLIDAASGQSTLLLPNGLGAGVAHVDTLAIWPWYDATRLPAGRRMPQALDELQRILPDDIAQQRVGIERGHLPEGLNLGETVDLGPALHASRRVKQPDEIALIRDAVRVVEAGHAAARDAIQPGVSELEVYNAIVGAMVRAAGHPLHPLGDFASGERVGQGGGPPTERIINPGELMIADIFPIVNGYRADFTATYATAELSDAQQALEDALHAALQAGEAALQPGALAGDVYRAVQSVLDERGFGDAFPHHAGHGLGLDHPEAPFFVPDSDEVLLAGDVVTLEPGAYRGTLGARIEHNYRITDETDAGFERLSNHDTRFRL